MAGWRFVWDVALRWYHGGIGDLAAGVTFWLLVSMPAAVLALLAALGPIDAFIGYGFETQMKVELEEFIERVLTDEGGEVQAAITALFDQTNPELLTFSVAVALWSISRGFAGLIRALEDIYDIQDGRPWYYTRVVAVFLGLGTILVPLPLVAMEELVWSQITDGFLERSVRSLLAMLVLVLWAATFYHFAPAKRNKWRHDLPGALVAASLWWILTLGFARYVAMTAGSNEVTAVVGAGLLALTWIWLAAQVLLIGGAVNFIYGERFGLSRLHKQWNLNEKLAKGTGEIKKIVNGTNGTNGEKP